MQFTDSLDHNVDVITELLQTIPPARRRYAVQVATTIENCIKELRRDRDPVVSIGVTFAILTFAQRLTAQQQEAQAENRSLIQLLS